MASSAWETIRNNRRREPRYRVRLMASVSVIEQIEESRWATVLSYTRDVSREGLCLIIPSSRMGCHNLEEANHVLQVVLVLPDGASVTLDGQLIYCTVYNAEPETGYLAGVKIAEINSEDRARYDEFIDSL